jgi:hypothetical protein
MPTSFIARSPQIYPNLDFWFENKPSGNPAVVHSLLSKQGDQVGRFFAIWAILYGG